MSSPRKVYIATSSDTSESTQDTTLLKSYATYDFSKHSLILVENANDADIILLVQDFGFRWRDYIKRLKEDTFIECYLEKIFVINVDDFAHCALPGLYCGLKRSFGDDGLYATNAYDLAYNPYILNANLNNCDRHYLGSWVGNRHSSNIRDELIELSKDWDQLRIEENKSWYNHNDSEKQSYAELLYQSFASICPKGWSPNSLRIYESMAAGCCPVIISDEWQPPDCGVELESFGIRISESDMATLQDTLLRVGVDELQRKGLLARQVWSELFAPEKIIGWRIKQIVSLYEHQCIDRTPMRTVWSSHHFQSRHGWLLPQRIFRKIKGVFWKRASK